MSLQSYRDLEVWQLAIELVENGYRLSRQFPADERYDLVPQIRRAAVSVPSNIAEGYGRFHRGDYMRHLSIASGSLTELETQLIIATRLGYISREDVQPVWGLARRIGQMLRHLYHSLRAEAG